MGGAPPSGRRPRRLPRGLLRRGAAAGLRDTPPARTPASVGPTGSERGVRERRRKASGQNFRLKSSGGVPGRRAAPAHFPDSGPAAAGQAVAGKGKQVARVLLRAARGVSGRTARGHRAGEINPAPGVKQ